MTPRGLAGTPGLGAAFAAVALGALLVGFPLAYGRGPPALPDGLDAASPDDFKTTTNGNFSIWISQPSTPVVPGSFLTAQFALSVTTPADQLPSELAVWVPQVAAVFRLPNASLEMFHPAYEVNFSQEGALTTGPTNISTLVKLTGTFNVSTPAVLSSQLVAVMTSAPYGSVAMSATWRWALAAPDGTTSFGPWSPAQGFEPAEYAELTSSGPSSLTPGSTFTVCVTSPEPDREFSLHLETANPYDDFVQVNRTTGPAGTAACWGATVAGWVTPQVILAHVWDYDQVTLLLYILKVTVIGPPAGNFGALGHFGTWSGLVTLCALAAGASVAAWSGVRFVRRRSPPHASLGRGHGVR
jgi:hypothetical protein